MILIVDDDPAFLAKAEALLNTGRGVFLAGNAEDAKSLIHRLGATFSVALIDLDLPGQDGFSLISEIRAKFPDLPVIAISGVLQSEVLDSALALGATATLRKPIDSDWNEAIARARASRKNP